MIETEVKIKVNSIQDIIGGLMQLDFIKASVVYEHDIYYNSTTYNLREKDMAVRVREERIESSAYTLNYKGPKLDDKTMTREEVEFTIPSFEAGDTFLRGLGFIPAGEVEKTRTHYVKDDVTICVDSVTGLGDFAEIEIMAEEDEYKEALARIEQLVSKLGLSMADSIRRSYLSMLQEKYK